MSWLLRKRKPTPLLLSDTVLAARRAVHAHMVACPVEAIKHVMTWQTQNGGFSRRPDTVGHHEVSKWLARLEELNAECDTVERASRLKVSMCQALGIDPNSMTDAGALAAVRVIRSEEEPTNG